MTLFPIDPSPDRHVLFSAVAGVCGWNLANLQDDRRGWLNAACKRIAPHWDGTPEQVVAKARGYRAMFTGRMTPSALAKWWLQPDRVNGSDRQVCYCGRDVRELA